MWLMCSDVPAEQGGTCRRRASAVFTGRQPFQIYLWILEIHSLCTIRDNHAGLVAVVDPHPESFKPITLLLRSCKSVCLAAETRITTQARMLAADGELCMPSRCLIADW
jgi:hypothetical protein